MLHLCDDTSSYAPYVFTMCLNFWIVNFASSPAAPCAYSSMLLDLNLTPPEEQEQEEYEQGHEQELEQELVCKILVCKIGLFASIIVCKIIERNNFV